MQKNRDLQAKLVKAGFSSEDSDSSHSKRVKQVHQELHQKDPVFEHSSEEQTPDKSENIASNENLVISSESILNPRS